MIITSEDIDEVLREVPEEKEVLWRHNEQRLENERQGRLKELRERYLRRA